MLKKFIFFLFLTTTLTIRAQHTYWQQHVDYTMEIDMNMKNYQYKGKQKLVYTNNSPDTLNVVFYHLQFNAFQPGSQMDVRLQHITDPDKRMVITSGLEEKHYESRIAKLKPDEIGYIKVNSLKQNGKDVKYEVIGTILKVYLNEPILPRAESVFDMNFKGQVPVQIRRSGRNNKEGVALSMAQWYPKMAEYDFEGWHANQYIAREFYGVWGNFDVKIKIDKDYTLGGTGYLQNPQEIGHGYEDKSRKLNLQKGKKITWHFKAPKVHDFTWAADKDYVHDIVKVPDGPVMHFLYKNKPQTVENWKKMQPEAVKTMQFYNEKIGKYPYRQYSIIQGGDGGMEYGMCTLVNGDVKLKSLIGTMRHEMAHSWFQFVLATNETKYPWMDEGFTSYISTMAANEFAENKNPFPFEGTYGAYTYLAKSGMEEPLTTQADRYNTNMAYSIGSYVKGQIFLSQLGYIIGKEKLGKTLKKYYEDFKFKHPNANDFIRTAEKVSDIQLGWYLNEWVETTHTIDYAVKSINGNTVTLERIGQMPMPIDLKVTYTDDTTENFYIPLMMMLAKKETKATTLDYWGWAIPTYTFKTAKPVKSVEIDPEHLMADIERNNNTKAL